MATLKHLAVGGVRSFGADDNDIQYISFDKPFTLILGRNGCGKTTIIESLKYACSGSMPGQGQHFVRDPKLDRKVETRAQVKLSFTSCHGKDSAVVRSMSCTQKLKSLMFKTVDTTATVTDANGKSTHTSGRHTDIDDLMTRLLGVSKPILNYVIFCHQEDSYWPLDEGKKLKERFDEIFDSTKYQKCMEQIRKTRAIVLKDKRIDEEALGYLEATVKSVRLKRKELDGLLKRYNDAGEKIEEFEKDISDCKRESDKWYRRYEDFRKIEKERDGVQNELVKYEGERDTLKRLITYEFAGTKEELQAAIQDFDKQLHDKEKAVNQVKRDQNKNWDLEKEIQSKMSNIQKQIGKLEADKNHQQKITDERNGKLSVLAQGFGLPALEDGATDTEVDDLTGKVRKELANLAYSITSLKHKQEKEQGVMQERINKCREVKTKLEAEISLKNDSISSNKEDIQKLTKRLSEVSMHVGRKQKIDEELLKCRQDREKAAQSEDSQALSSEIGNLRKDCSDLDNRQRQLLAEAKQLYKYQEAQKDLQKSEEKYNECLSDIRKLRSKNYEFISDHLKESDDGNIKRDLETLIQTFRKELDVLRSSLNEKKREVAAFDQERNMKKDLLQKKLDEVANNSESVRAELLGSKNVDEALTKIDNEIELAQNDKGVFNASQFVYTRYIKQLDEPKPCCPLCHRGFDKEDQVTDLLEDLRKSLSEFPARVVEANNKLIKYKERERKLLLVKPVQKAIEKLEKIEIPQLREAIDAIEESQSSAYEDITCLEGSIQEPEDNLRRAESIQNDIFELDRCHKESKQLARQIEKLKRDNPLSTSSRSYDEAMAEHQVIQDELSAKRHEKDEQEERQRDYVKRLNDLDQKINNLVAQQLKIQELVQQEESIRERKKELLSLTNVLKKELEQLEESLTPALEEKKKAETALDSVKEQHRKVIQEKEKERGEKDKQMSSFTTLQNSLNEFKGRNIEGAIQGLKGQLLGLEEETENLKKDMEELIEKSKKLQNLIDGHQRQKKEFEENLNLMEVAEKIVKQKKKLKQVEEKLGNSDLPGIKEKCQELDKQLSTLHKQVSEHKGNQRGLEENIASRRKELDADDMKNAEQKFKEKFVRFNVLSHVEKDLQKYFSALDHAMQKFHADRMACINKYIRELWRIIYKGNDIDYIEIKTDESAFSHGAVSATKETDKKRTYSYRVVQVKNGTEIEMRGRCSAGQKVLACLIIRMALAETFSANCGILTLDEPTTNLDKNNITSLCQAISDIVNDNQARKTFQLVVITHDHEFLKAMSSLDSLHHYWEVSRNHQSKSLIRKRNL